MESGTFSQRVWELATSIPEGRVTTYGIIARTAGGGGQAARSISSILSKSPNPGAIPWHRIVYAGGKVWMSEEHDAQRRELYELEGIEVTQKNVIKNFEDVVYYFD